MPPPPSEPTRADAGIMLTWRVHLLRREPHKLPGLLAVLIIAVVCVWLMFGQALTALVAALLLLGASSDFLLPITYRITEEGVFADGLTSRLALRWKETRRCLREPLGVTLSPLSKPSRLDAFRGVTLRFAPEGEPGDRESVLAAIARFAPSLLYPAGETPQEAIG
ncbi:MAG TPA: hypothetical protein VFB38_20435 [Chthonomonadaceae bacterium]|nr:hypothetical protein [Chthonomonadaceae bacterium]